MRRSLSISSRRWLRTRRRGGNADGHDHAHEDGHDDDNDNDRDHEDDDDDDNGNDDMRLCWLLISHSLRHITA